MKSLVVAVALLFVPVAAFAGSIADCEKIAEPDGYNRCLASFGPTAHDHRIAAEPGASPEESGTRSTRHARGRHGRGHYATHRRGHSASSRGHGRVRMVIDVGGKSRTR